MFGFRSILYWLLCSSVAVIAAKASEQLPGPLNLDMPLDAAQQALPVPEPARAVLLGLGIMALAFTYRRAWVNMKRSHPEG